MNQTIPQMSPSISSAEINAMTNYLQSDPWLTEFTKTKEFEESLKKYTKSKHCIVTNNGTITLIIALIALGLKPGDEIIVPNLTMIATPNAALLVGIKPVFVDIEPSTLCLDIDAIENNISKKTKAICYVSLNGRSGNMYKLLALCKKHKLRLIEDAAQSLGSYYKNKHLGTFGDIGSLSFSPPKIITTGQGGALLVNSPKLNKIIRKIKDFGRPKGGIDIHHSLGWNFKFTDLQAVIGIEQMKKLPERVQRKKEIYASLYENLRQIKQIEFISTDLSQTTPWFNDIYVDKPKKLASHLASYGIGTRLFYPAVCSQKIYRSYGSKKNMPYSYYYASRGLWLPSSSFLSTNDIAIIIKRIREYYS